MTIQSTLQQHFVLNTFNLQERIKSNIVSLHKSKMNQFSVSYSLLTSEICLCISSSSSFNVISLSVVHSVRKTRSNSTVQYTLYSCCNYREKYRRTGTPGGGRESRIKKTGASLENKEGWEVWCLVSGE